MKKAACFFVLLFVILCGAGCISFTIIPSFPQEAYAEVMVLCSGVDETGELLEPLGVKSEFTSGDESVFCFIEMKNISRRIRMRWRWYGPDKTLSRDSEDVVVNEEEQYLETLTAYDELMLNVRDEEDIVGRWTVVVLIDDRLVARREFSVRLNESRGKR